MGFPYLCVEKFSAVDETVYIYIDFSKIWSPYSRKYHLQNVILFETNHTSSTENGDNEFVFIDGLLIGHVFDCDVTKVTGVLCGE